MADMRLVVAGAAGRMGRMLVQAIHASEELVLAGALERKGSPALGQDIGTLAGLGPLGISITDDPLSALAHADGVIDFTAPQATLELAATRVVPIRSQKSSGPAKPRPAVSHPEVTTVASTINAIRGRVSREMSAAKAAALPAKSLSASRDCGGAEGCMGATATAEADDGANADAVKSAE